MSLSKAPLTPPSQDTSKASLDSEKLLGLPILQRSSVPIAVVPLKLPLTISYVFLLLLSMAYLILGAYASYWRTSYFIGPIAGLNSVFFALALVVVCSKPIHPLALPHSASLRVRVWATMLAVGWAATVSLISSYLATKRMWPSPGPTREWACAELATSIAAFLSSMLVAALQVAQHDRYRKKTSQT